MEKTMTPIERQAARERGTFLCIGIMIGAVFVTLIVIIAALAV